MKRGLHQAFTLVFSVMIFITMIIIIYNQTITQTMRDFEFTKNNIEQFEKKVDANLKLTDEHGTTLESNDNVNIIVQNTGRIDLTNIKLFLAKKNGNVLPLNNISGGTNLNILHKDQNTSFLSTGKLKTRDVLFISTDQEAYYYYIY